MARLSDADQNRFPLPGLDPRGADRAGSGVVYGPRPAVGDAWNTGMAIVLLQSADDGPGTLSRARHLHPTDEAKEHASMDARRRPDYPSRHGVLRLNVIGSRLFKTP